MKAIEQLERMDLRRHRAMSFTAMLTEEIRHILPRESLREVHEHILDLMYRNGVAWTTDEDRAKMGLEPRDDLGWTPSERIKDENLRREAMFNIMALPIKSEEFEFSKLVDDNFFDLI